ncbi:hypothetical protein HPB50_004988 [Hyalomma asiaticum]|uniref:Uncharacterized protein n=1 Tax=Hyalomma asiaticum TaxID=266040 RepID=A0ACB7RMQ6_HYAAI|nr:hypothetical protein HPB50_004988 [Hyalomma asiaticum]
MIPNQDSVNPDQKERTENHDGEASSIDAESGKAKQDPGTPAGSHVPSTGATQPSPMFRDRQGQAESGVSEVSVASVPLALDSSLSMQRPSEAPSCVSSVPLPDLVSEASQTFDSGTARYRSLTLQYSPSRRRQQASTPELEQHFIDSLPVSPSTTQETSTSLLSQETQVPKFWSSASFSNLFSNPSLTNRALFRGAAQPDSFQNVKQESQEPTMSSAAIQQAGGTLSSMEASGENPVPGESATWIVPWSETAQTLDQMPGTPQAIEDAHPPSSPVTPSSSMLDSEGQRASLEASEHDEIFAETRTPWLTLFVTMFQLLTHWNFLHKYYADRCASYTTIVEGGHWERVLFAAFHHKDVVHLTFNLMSFFVSGLVLEAALGTAYFGVVFVALVSLVGSVYTSAVLAIYECTSEPQWLASCAHTFAGVTVAADVLTRTHYGRVKIRYGTSEFAYMAFWALLVEMFILFGVSTDNLLPMASGLLVGGFLAKTRPERLVFSARSPRRTVDLYVVPNAPVTFLLSATIIVAYMYGPYRSRLSMAEPELAFEYPVWQPLILATLYLPNLFQLVYVFLSLLKVGSELEQDLGHVSFLRHVAGLLVGVNLMLDGLTWAARTHTAGFNAGHPSPATHSSSCGCGVIGVLLALKIIHHERRNTRRYRYPMASFSVPLPFWVGVTIDLAHTYWTMPAGSSVGHVTGVILGLRSRQSQNRAFCELHSGRWDQFGVK